MSTDTRPPAPHHHPDAEELAAFVDGRLRGAARERMVAHLADCADCHEMMIDVVTVLRDPAVAAAEDDAPAGDGEAADDGVSPTPSGRVLRPPAGRFRRALPLAAALAAAVLAALLVWTPAGRWILTPVLPSPAGVADLAAPLPAGVGVDRQRIDGHGWPVPRGDEPVVTGATARAFRLGVRNAELQVALSAGDAEAAAVLGTRIEELLDGPLTVHLTVLYSPPPTLALLADADRFLAERLADDPPWYALGRWAGVATLAAQHGHREWFEQTAPRRTLRALRRHDWPQGVGAPLRQIVALADGGVDRDELPELAAALDRLIARAGGRTAP